MSSGGGSGNPSTNKGKGKASSGSSGRIRTLSDLNRQPSPDSDFDGDSDEPQEYYTGGEKSGMIVQDPTNGNHDVNAIFEQARQMGAPQVPFESLQSASVSRVFTGTARTLTGETVPSVQPQQPVNVVHNIFFWSDGFTVNDGPLRRFEDPENASFLESIKKAECPKELEPANRRLKIDVILVKKEGKYVEPVKPKIPFQGAARTLGSGSSPAVDSTEISAGSAGERRNITSRSVGNSVDDSLPSTSIQIRLADCTRLVARFNYHHTVGDIRDFINASSPEAIRNYKLQAVGFPPKQLCDDSQTIEQAGLANSVVMQKL